MFLHRKSANMHASFTKVENAHNFQNTLEILEPRLATAGTELILFVA